MQATSTVEMDSVQVYSHFFDLFEPLIIDFRELLWKYLISAWSTLFKSSPNLLEKTVAKS